MTNTNRHQGWQAKAQNRINDMIRKEPLTGDDQHDRDGLMMGSMLDETNENLDDDPAYDRAEHERMVTDRIRKERA